MSGYAPFQEALAEMIKAEVQAAVAQQYQVEVDDLRNALAIAQRDLNSTRNAFDNLHVAFTVTENNLKATRTDLDDLRKAFNSSQHKSKKARTDVTNPRDTLTVTILRDDKTNRYDTAATTKEDILTSQANQLDNANRRQAQMQPPAMTTPVAANAVDANFTSKFPSEYALWHYARGLRLQFKDTLPYSSKLCGTSDPWVIQELLNKQLVNIATSSFDSFKRLVLKSHHWHPICQILNEPEDMASPHANTIHKLRRALKRYAPGTRLTLPDRFFSRRIEENGPVDFRIYNTERCELNWDLCCRLAHDYHRILKDAAAVDTFCLVVENHSDFFHYHSLLFLSRS